MADVNVAILGLERLGTSFGLALKRYMENKEARHNFTITGFDDRGYNTKEAKRLGAVDATARGPFDAVKGAHIVVIAAHYYKVENIYQAIGAAVQPGAVVLDASPLKLPSVQWAAAHLPQDPDTAAYMVGITPVLNPDALYEANTEIEKARANLFDSGTLIVTPAASCPAEAVELASEFGRIIGAAVHFMDVDEHDGLIAAMEGVPAVLAVGLFQAFLRSQGWDDMRRLTNPAFGILTSPLRFQHPDSLWGLLHYNRENMTRHLTTLIETLEQMRDSLQEDADGLAIEAILEESARQYEEWEGSRMANRWDRAGEEPDLPDGSVFSSMGGMLFGRRPKKDADKKE